MPSGTLIYKHIWKEPDYHKTTLFQDISSKKKEEISFFIGKIVDFSICVYFFVSCCTKRTLQIYDY